MKRLHLHISVDDLEQSIKFYSVLFDAEPTVRKPDYAKWMLDDPFVNLAITTGETETTGVSHVGLQTENEEKLNEITSRLKLAEMSVLEQSAANCCYAVSDKSWVSDPSGVKWETFYSHGEITEFGADATSSLLSQMKSMPDASLAIDTTGGGGSPNGGCCRPT